MTIFINVQGQIKSNLASFFVDIQLCLEQGSAKINKIRMYNKNIFIVLFIWVLCSFILTKCFTGLLLKTYFIRKPTLAINTLEDIVNDPDISVTGKITLNLIKSYKPEIYDILIKRLEIYENKLGINTELDPNESENEQIIKDVINRKAVLLQSLYVAEMVELVHPHIKVAENKYFLQYQYWYISKSHPNSKNIYIV